MTAFAYSLENSHPKIVILLIEYGAKPLPWGYHSIRRPLPTAAEKGYADLVSLLLTHGVDVNERVEQNKMTALMIASKHGHTEIVRRLLSHQADKNLISSGGFTALDFAEVENHTEIIGILKSSGAAKKHVLIGDSIESKYQQSLISHLSDKKLKRQQERLSAEDQYHWGQQICISLKRQTPKQVILEESYYQFWGEELSNAMWEAALEVIYPEFKNTAGVAQKFYSLKFIRALTEYLPDDNLINAFDAEVAPMYRLKYQLHKQNLLLKEARDILLPRLMTGMIDVDQIDLPDIALM